MPFWIYIIIAAILLIIVGGVIASFIVTNPIAKRLYNTQWVRKDGAHFERGCSDASFDFHLDMFNKGMLWREHNKHFIKEVEIKSFDDLKLVGEYFDFGFKKAVIIMAGRMESCYYATFYAEPFKQAGYNVLTIDPRAHGLSEGKYITLGKKEGLDLLTWANYLYSNHGVASICLYGICGGATAACFALTNADCPKYIDTFISDGMFYSFFDVYRRHIKDEKKPVYPIIWTIFNLIKKNNDVNPYECAPIKLVPHVYQRSLMLVGEEDIFAVPKMAQKLFTRSGATDKKYVLIPHARHSHLRYFNKDVYDASVINFLKESHSDEK